MSFFYDGISEAEIKSLYSKGILRGLTTNLTLINNAKRVSGLTRLEILNPLIELSIQYCIPISIQLEANSISKMVDEVHHLMTQIDNSGEVYFKVPVDFEKLEVIKLLADQNIRINATCITSQTQAQMAAEAGAKIISFFWGKMSDQAIDPFLEISNFNSWKLRKNLGQVTTLVGSIRQISTISAAFNAGADVVTTSYSNLQKVADQLLSLEANRVFQETNLA